MGPEGKEAKNRSSDRHAENLLICRADLIADPRFATNEDRVRHCDELNGILAEYFRQAPIEGHLEQMQAQGVTVAPVLWAGDLVGHPYAEGRGLFDTDDGDEEVPNCPVPAAIPRLSRTPGRLRRRAPTMGEHTQEILDELSPDA